MTISEEDKKLGAENKLQAPADFDGPLKKGARKCTDPLCFLAILLVWISAFGIAVWSYSEGADPFLIIYPNNYKGRICGYQGREVDMNLTDIDNIKDNLGDLGDQMKDDMKDFMNNIKGNASGMLPPYLYMTDILMNGKCISGCPNESILNPKNKQDLICKHNFDINKMPQCIDPNTKKPWTNPIRLTVCGACMYIMKSTDVMYRCIPNNMTELRDVLQQNAESLNIPDFKLPVKMDLSDVSAYIERFAQDVTISWRVILTMGIAGSTFLSFLTLYLIRLPGLLKTITWISCILTPLLVTIGGSFCYLLTVPDSPFGLMGSQLSDLQEDFDINEKQLKMLKCTAYGLWGIGVVLLLILIFLRKRINLAVGITKASAHALTDLPMTVFYPFIQLITFMFFFIPWLLVLLFLASMRNLEQVPVDFGDFELFYQKWTYDDVVFYMFWYMLFVFFWTAEFIVAMGQLTLAISFSTWYFSPQKGSLVSFRMSIIHSMNIAFFKHAGTAAFGSLLIAIVRLVRSILLYTHKKLKQSGANNKLVDIAMCCCQCCLWCVEKCLKFINKNAYIQTAIFGYPFCKAAREAFFLILRNAARMTAVGVVSSLAVWFMKLVIVAGIGVASFFTMEWLYSDYMYSITAVTIFICIISLIVVNIFLETIGIAIATLFQCFIADEEMYPEGSPFVPEELDNFLKHM